MIYTWAVASNTGLVRDHNEDGVYPDEDGQSSGPALVAVADGLGGHAAGGGASRLALDAAAAMEGGASQRVSAANAAIIAAGLQRRDLAGMGTTLTLAVLEADGVVRIGHVGDSRAYLFRSDELTQITRDHTVVAEAVEAGQLSPEDAEHHPRRHILSRALGTGWKVLVDEVSEQMQPHDRILLCTDGLTNMVSDTEIATRLREAETLQEAAWGLAEAANDAGGEDNITVAAGGVTE